MVDKVAEFLMSLKGKSADNFRVIIEAYKVMFAEQKDAFKLLMDEQNKKIIGLQDHVTELSKQNNEFKIELNTIRQMENKCLEENVKANDVIRNLAEYIIFGDDRPQNKRDLIQLINKKES